ncbi:hypothetical protein ACJELR_25600, partial [Escherichia coli]
LDLSCDRGLPGETSVPFLRGPHGSAGKTVVHNLKHAVIKNIWGIACIPAGICFSSSYFTQDQAMAEASALFVVLPN